MNQKDLSDLTDEELLQEAKKLRSASITNAFLIGFLIGIIIFSVVKNTWGLLTLIPLYIIYKLSNQSKYEKTELEILLKERDLKIRK